MINTNVIFYWNHAYSTDRIYQDTNTWEYRITVINPRHTDIKFDMSLEDFSTLFNISVYGMDMDNMFREDNAHTPENQ